MTSPLPHITDDTRRMIRRYVTSCCAQVNGGVEPTLAVARSLHEFEVELLERMAAAGYKGTDLRDVLVLLWMFVLEVLTEAVDWRAGEDEPL